MIKGIRYYSLLNCGYGDAALTYIEGLLEQNIPLRWSPLVNTQWGLAPWRLLPNDWRPDISEMATGTKNREAILQCLEQDIDYDVVFLHTIPEPWPKLVESDRINIGYTVWETDRLPAHWPEVLNSVEHICVPCEFNHELFSFGEGRAVSVVPHAIDKPLYKNTDQDRHEYKRKRGIGDGVYIFYVIATWDPRKSMSETLRTFLRAFDADDKVCLLVKTDEKVAGDRAVSDIVAEIQSEFSNAPEVVLIAERVSSREIQLIHEISDCFFSLTHCEGWGLGAFSAAATGNPVIITGWGGQLDYLPDDISYHVRYVLNAVQEKSDWASYDKSQNWAYADTDDARKILRHCYQNRQEAKEKGLALKAFVNDRYSAEKVTGDLLRAINDAHTR